MKNTSKNDLDIPPTGRLPNGKLSFMLAIPDLPDLLLREFDTLVYQIREDIHELGDDAAQRKDWERVLVISGAVSLNPHIDVQAVLHKGHDLPATIVAGGGGSDRTYR